MEGERPGRARYYAVSGVMLLVIGFGLMLAGAVVSNSYSTAERCLSESGAGGSSGGSAGFGSRTYSPLPSPLPGRCTGRVNGVYFEGSREEFPALMAAARDEATPSARPLGWTGVASVLLGAVLLWRSRRVEPDQLAHLPPTRVG